MCAVSIAVFRVTGFDNYRSFGTTAAMGTKLNFPGRGGSPSESRFTDDHNVEYMMPLSLVRVFMGGWKTERLGNILDDTFIGPTI